MWPWFEFLLPFLGGSFLLVSLCLERGSSDREVEASDFDIEMDPQLQHTVETHPVVAFVRFCHHGHGVFFWWFVGKPDQTGVLHGSAQNSWFGLQDAGQA